MVGRFVDAKVVRMDQMVPCIKVSKAWHLVQLFLTSLQRSTFKMTI